MGYSYEGMTIVEATHHAIIFARAGLAPAGFRNPHHLPHLQRCEGMWTRGWSDAMMVFRFLSYFPLNKLRTI